jgi:CheY-like chemotaxis protein
MLEPDSAPGAKIMIVEDEGLIANHISYIVGKNGYDVTSIASSSQEALANIVESPPQLILMDISIDGELDGIETTLKLRETFDIPVVFLTAQSDQQTRERAEKTGFEVVKKPVQEAKLISAMGAALRKHRVA